MKLPTWLEQAILRDEVSECGLAVGMSPAGGVTVHVRVPGTQLELVESISRNEEQEILEHLQSELARDTYVTFFGAVTAAKSKAFRYFARRASILVTRSLDWSLQIQLGAWGSRRFELTETVRCFYDTVGKFSLESTEWIQEAQVRAYERFGAALRKAEETALAVFYEKISCIEDAAFDVIDSEHREIADRFLSVVLAAADDSLASLGEAIEKARIRLQSDLRELAVGCELPGFMLADPKRESAGSGA